METPEEQQEHPLCERCGAALTPVVYGFPTFETFEAAERGEVVLGGCLAWEERPRELCRSCRDGEAARG